MKIVVLASGDGSNFEVIAKKFKVEYLITNKIKSNSLNRAKKLCVNSIVISNNEELLNKLIQINPDLICLAGYMRKIDKKTVEKFPNKIINLHPSLLPKYIGLNAFEKSFENKDEYLGATIHYVDEGLDTGKIIRQEKFLRQNEYSQNLEILKKIEHKIYIETIEEFIKGDNL